MAATDDLFANAGRHAATFDRARMTAAPSRRLTILACMDARLDPYELLGMRAGDAHVIRNAGGIVTDDAVRSIAISQRLLGTVEIMLIHHTDCGMLTFTDDAFRSAVEDEVGVRPPWETGAFTDLEGSVRESMTRLRDNPFLPHRDSVRGFVYDVHTGELREVK